MSKRNASYNQFGDNKRNKKITNYIKLTNDTNDESEDEEKLPKYTWKTEFENVYYTQIAEGGDASEEFDTLYKVEVKLMEQLKGREYFPRDIYIFLRKQADMNYDNECVTVHPLELDWMVKQMKENKSVRLKGDNWQLWATRKQKKSGIFYTLSKRKRSQDRKSITLPADAANALIAEVEASVDATAKDMAIKYKIRSTLEGREVMEN